MAIAVARRPVTPFETQVPMPDWQLTPEEEMFGDAEVDANALQPLVDENGNPLPVSIPQEPGAPPSLVRPDGTGEPSQQELDQAFPPQPQPRYPQPRVPPQPQPRPPQPQDPLAPRPDPSQPRPYAT
jgi:penicillin-binding protein 1A